MNENGRILFPHLTPTNWYRMVFQPLRDCVGRPVWQQVDNLIVLQIHPNRAIGFAQSATPTSRGGTVALENERRMIRSSAVALVDSGK